MRIAAQPPGPGFPAQAPSVKMVTRRMRSARECRSARLREQYAPAQHRENEAERDHQGDQAADAADERRPARPDQPDRRGADVEEEAPDAEDGDPGGVDTDGGPETPGALPRQHQDQTEPEEAQHPRHDTRPRQR